MLYSSTFISSKLFVGAYFAWWLYFKGLKFGDLTQIRQSFHPSKFLVLRYMVHNVIIVSETVHGIDSMYGAILVNVCD